jgi:hypothetical protein
MEKENIQKALHLIENAEKALATARAILQGSPLSFETANDFAKSSSHTNTPSAPSTSYEENGTQIIEGYFTGESMLGPDGKIFPIPPNYASKSKLVQGDRMKLSILPNGTMLYKQIAPAVRKIVKGYLVREDQHYYIQTEAKMYRVLLASVTYFRVEIGDQVSLWIPDAEDAEWGAIEALIPSISTQNQSPSEAHDDFESMSF